jgi:hypothetical protein
MILHPAASADVSLHGPHKPAATVQRDTNTG